MSNALLEAMSWGLACVVSDIPGNRAVIDDASALRALVPHRPKGFSRHVKGAIQVDVDHGLPGRDIHVAHAGLRREPPGIVEHHVDPAKLVAIAEKIGLQAGDQLVSIDGRRVSTHADLVSALNAAADAGQSTQIVFQRGGQTYQLAADLSGQGALDAACRYIKERKQFGKAIAEFQGVQFQLTDAEVERSGDVVGRLQQAVVQRDSFTLGPVDLQVGYGERIVIEGPNGSGKSTLLGALLGEIPLTSGQQWRGPGVVVGRLEQARQQLTDQPTVLAAFMAVTGMLVPEARTLLAKFGIGAEHVNRPAESLSPGERTRLVLALLMAKGSNCLVLDEPTNHLDMPAIEQLEQAVETFGGTVLLVTHDRSLLTNVRRTRTIVLRAGQITSDTPT